MRRTKAWLFSLTVLFVGSVLGGILITAARALLPQWLRLMIFPYSPPMLVLEALIALHIGFWLRPLVQLPWWLSGALLGLLLQIAHFVPYDLHTLLPYHWSSLVTVPAAVVGMALGVPQNNPALSQGA